MNSATFVRRFRASYRRFRASVRESNLDVAALQRERLAAEPWFIDRVDVSPAGVSVDGWSFATGDGDAFFLNGRPFDEVQYPLRRADVAELFWQRRDAEMCGFRLRSDSGLSAYEGGMLRISRAADGERIDAGRDSWWLPDPAAHPDLPDPDRRFRVVGNREARGFLDTGATDFHRLNAVACRVAGKALWQHDSVLDWGVGCGRVARHFPATHSAALAGCDIDHDNVTWCADHLPGRFVPSSLAPPLPFAEASFDLVYGISVFTHLKESLQDRWLEELRRVTRPGALVLTTVHGETAVDFCRLPPAAYAKLNAQVEANGLLVGSANHQLDGHVDEPGEYVNVFHHRGYVLRHWARWFDVLHVIPGYIFTHDLVVLRAR